MQIVSLFSYKYISCISLHFLKSKMFTYYHLFYLHRSNKGFKSEWATVRDQVLYVGSMGKEWTTADGLFQNNNPMYIKAVTTKGEVRSAILYFCYIVPNKWLKTIMSQTSSWK